jgi:hypothetical protein
MHPARLRTAAARILDVAPDRVLPVGQLLVRIADDTGHDVTDKALLDALAADPAFVVLRSDDATPALALLAREARASYEVALREAATDPLVMLAADACVRTAGLLDVPVRPDAFPALAEPLLQLWRRTDDDELREEIALALSGLHRTTQARDLAAHSDRVDTVRSDSGDSAAAVPRRARPLSVE